MHRILVISNRTCECPAVIDEVERCARVASGAVVLLVAPAVNSRVKHLVSDTDAALADAQERVDNAIGQLAERGVSISGAVGDANPLQAIEDALTLFAADQLIVATHPPEHSHWLEKKLLDRASQRFGLPTTHVVSRYGLEAAD